MLSVLAATSAHADINLNAAKLCLDAAIATGQVSKQTVSQQVARYISRVREINKIARNQKTNAAVNRSRAGIIISGMQNDLADSAIPSICVWNIESSISEAKSLAKNGNMIELDALTQKTLKQLNQIAVASQGGSRE